MHYKKLFCFNEARHCTQQGKPLVIYLGACKFLKGFLITGYCNFFPITLEIRTTRLCLLAYCKPVFKCTLSNCVRHQVKTKNVSTIMQIKRLALAFSYLEVFLSVVNAVGRREHVIWRYHDTSTTRR